MNHFHFASFLFIFIIFSCNTHEEESYWFKAQMAEEWQEKSPHFAKEILEEMKQNRSGGLEPEHEELLREVNRKIDELQNQN